MRGCTFQSCCLCTVWSFFLLLATFVSNCDKVPRLQVCMFSATICGQRRVAAGEEMDGVGMVMDTGSLAARRAPTRLALVTIVSLPRFSWHSLWLNWRRGEDLAWGGFYLCDNNGPQAREVAACIVHCWMGLSHAGSLCIVQLFWRRDLQFVKGHPSPTAPFG